jgi:hypothetical protein
MHPMSSLISELRAAAGGGFRSVVSLARAVCVWMLRRLVHGGVGVGCGQPAPVSAVPRGLFFCDAHGARAASVMLGAADLDALRMRGEGPLNGRFVLSTGTEVFPGAVPWRTAGRDVEDTFTLNRMHFLRDVARAYAVSGSERLAQGAARLLDAWIADNPCGSLPVWESYSVAERIVNLAWAVWLFDGTDAAAQVRGMASSLVAVSALYLERNLERHNGAYNNHLINDARGLWYAGVLFDFAGAGRCRETARDILERAIREKVTAGGWYDEGSTAYHLLLTRAFLECLLLGSLNGYTFSAVYRCTAQRMLSCCRYLGLDGTQPVPLIGDVCPDNNIPELIAVIPRLAYLLGDPSTPAVPDDRFTVWYRAPAPDRPFSGCTQDLTEPDAERTGTFASYDRHAGVWMRCQRHYPRMTGSHAHYDAGSVVYVQDGCTIIPDPGTETYARDGLLAAMSTFAHSGVSVDGMEQAVFPPSLAEGYGTWYGSGTGVDAEVREASFDLCSYVFTGFSRADSRLVLRRTVARLRQGGVVIVDTLPGCGRSHRFETRFNVAGTVTCDTGVIHLVCGGVRCDMHVRLGERPVVCSGVFFPRYGTSESMNRLVFSGDGRWMNGAWYVLVPVRPDRPGLSVRGGCAGLIVESDQIRVQVRFRGARESETVGRLVLEREDIVVSVHGVTACAA